MNSDRRDWEFRHYVANSIMWIPENKHYIKTLYEMMNPEPIDTRSVEEITEEVVSKAGITLID